MKRRVAMLALVGVAAVGGSVAAPAAADDARIHTVLTGAAERPGPGDLDAIGRAYITIDDAANQLCLVLQYANVDGTPSGLHIHVAPTTAPGPIVVPFATPTQPNTGVFTQCVVVADEALLDDIAANPSAYYINLHSLPGFGPGAIRGQLQAI